MPVSWPGRKAMLPLCPGTMLGNGSSTGTGDSFGLSKLPGPPREQSWRPQQHSKQVMRAHGLLGTGHFVQFAEAWAGENQVSVAPAYLSCSGLSHQREPT